MRQPQQQQTVRAVGVHENNHQGPCRACCTRLNSKMLTYCIELFNKESIGNSEHSYIVSTRLLVIDLTPYLPLAISRVMKYLFEPPIHLQSSRTGCEESS